MGLPEDSSANDAKEAYQRLALAYHPDRNPQSGEIFIQMTAAYRTLTAFFNKQSKQDALLTSHHSKNTLHTSTAIAESKERRNRRGRPTDRRFEIIHESSYLGTSIKEHI